MSSDFLDCILDYKKRLIKQKRPIYDSIKSQLDSENYTRYSIFKKSISANHKINIIAEIKKASPSRGLIRENFDLLQIANMYEKHGASAISVLTEDKFFLGDVRYLKKVSDNVHLPVLAKDFFIDEGQIYEARLNGASAVLLIMAILNDAQVKDMLKLAHRLDLDCLVEVHSKDELLRALDCGADIIGINHRDLKTFSIYMDLSQKLLPFIPKGKIIVAESGFNMKSDIAKFRDLGINVFLIGEILMREEDIGRKLDELLSD